MKTSKKEFTTRQISGVLLLDKPTGSSSNRILQQIKHLFCAKKAGHTGTLDPIASGMLPICLGEATKFSQYLLSSDKTYLVQAKLGIRTDTADSEGTVIKEMTVPSISETEIAKAIAVFKGTIQQTPPMFSALKHRGKPLYEYARQGIEIRRQARSITIYNIHCEILAPDVLQLKVHCSKGTYIRTLVDELGELLGCGAHVIALRRVSLGNYQENQMVSLDVLRECDSIDEKDKYLLPIESLLSALPVLEVNSVIKLALQRGQLPALTMTLSSGIFRLYAENEGFFGIGEVSVDGQLTAKRLLATDTQSIKST